jgi:hypothetical protein
MHDCYDHGLAALMINGHTVEFYPQLGTSLGYDLEVPASCPHLFGPCFYGMGVHLAFSLIPFGKGVDAL